MERKIEEKFNMSADISQISMADSSVEDNLMEIRSQSQSLLDPDNVNASEKSAENSDKVNIEGYSEELIPPSGPMSLLQELENGMPEAIISNYKSSIPVTEKLLIEVKKAAKEVQDSQSNSEVIEQETTDSNENSENVEEDMEDSENIEIESPEVIENSELLEEVMENDPPSDDMDVNDNVNDETAENAAAEDTMSLQNQLPFSKIRKIIKADAENNMIVNKEAVYVACIAAELFIANITQQAAKITHASKKKTLSLAHLKSAIAGSEIFDFVEGCFPDTF